MPCRKESAAYRPSSRKWMTRPRPSRSSAFVRRAPIAHVAQRNAFDLERPTFAVQQVEGPLERRADIGELGHDPRLWRRGWYAVQAVEDEVADVREFAHEPLRGAVRCGRLSVLRTMLTSVTRRRRAAARSVRATRAREPGCRAMRSCTDARWECSETCRWRSPARFRAARTPGRAVSWPLVMMRTASPALVAIRTSSGSRGCSVGSPPVSSTPSCPDCARSRTWVRKSSTSTSRWFSGFEQNRQRWLQTRVTWM